MPQDPTREEMEQIGNAIAAGKTIQAIKLYREITGGGLRESKDFIDKLTDELRSSQPERFTQQAVTRNSQVLVFWILWFSFVMGETIIYSILGKQTTHRQDVNPSLWMAGAVPVILSTINRWMIFPRFRGFQTALPSFIVGFALAEATVLLGLVLFPVHKEVLFGLGLAGTLQYAPVFASRLTR